MSKRCIFTIGELMQKSGVSIRTLRYYDGIDLLKPSDYTEGGHRLYSEEDLSTLQDIKSLQMLGFSLKDIKNKLQKNTADGSELLQSLMEQKQMFETKKAEITAILSNLDHLIETVEGEKAVNINVFCMMLQKLMFADDTKKWFEDHFSKDLADELLHPTTFAEVDLDKRWSKILSDIKQLTFEEDAPSSEQSQGVIESLINLMNETTQGNLDLIVENLPEAESLTFPNPFTKKEQHFLKEAMVIYQRD